MNHCTGNCEQGRRCVCQGMVIMRTEMNQQLADYADQYEASDTPIDIVYDVITHVLTTVALCAVVFSMLVLLGVLR